MRSDVKRAAMRYLLVAVVVAIVTKCYARPDGAPQSACDSMMPSHSGIEAQRNSPPYTVSAVRNGDKVRVTISSPIGEEFEGFMLQARSSSDKNRIVNGRFSTSAEAKATDCGRGRQNTLTQVNANPKSEIVTEWTPSETVNEDIIFRATVAKRFALFWLRIDSSPVRMKSEGTTQRMESRNSMYEKCFETKGCFGYPSDCVRQGDCEVLVTYTRRANGIFFALYGYLEQNNYMAMGLSTDNKMGDDTVTDCVRRGSNVVARESYNSGKTNIRTRELPRDSYYSEYKDGVSSCSFSLPFVMDANGKRYDLGNRTYHLLLAKGPMRGDGLDYHSGRIYSQMPVNLAEVSEIGAEGVTDAIKIHGTFMVTGWIGFVSLGILLAKHFKNTWENSTLCGVKIWFALHRGFMLAALTLIVIAFIVIFVHRDGWNYNTHSVLGCIATAFGLFQPIMALFRPDPNHPKRPIFNWLHYLVGNTGHLIAVITIFFAYSLNAAGLDDSFLWVMAIFVVVYIIFHFLFQVHTWTSGKKKDEGMRMNEMAAGRTNGTQSNEDKKVSENVFRILLLGIYSVFLLAILIALYCLIGVA